MYVLTIILFAAPCSLILAAWNRALKARRVVPEADWRMKCLIIALVAGSCTIAAGLSFVFAWLHAGGNPHGMGTPRGVWQVLRWVFWSALLGTIVFTSLSKGAREISDLRSDAQRCSCRLYRDSVGFRLGICLRAAVLSVEKVRFRMKCTKIRG